MKEININTETIQIPSGKKYTTEDLEKMFGRRIKKAIHIFDDGKKAIIFKKMQRIIKPWKFWNADIRKTHKNHVGYLIVPWVIKYENPEVFTFIKEN